MKQKTGRKLLGLLLTLAMVIGLMPVMSLTAYAAGGTKVTKANVTVNSVAPNHIHDDITFTAWTSTTSLPATAGNYVLTNDVTISSTWNVPEGTTNLCLDGHSITMTGDARVIYVPSGGTLGLYDVEDNTGTITGGKGDFGAGVRNDGIFVMNGGKISGNTASKNGGGVYVDNTFTMNGGYITGNTSNGDQDHAGGGVYVNKTFNMNGGTISGNNAKNGAGVSAVGQDANFNMTGGIIERNTASVYTGGVLLTNGATFIMSGGKIVNNVGPLFGGVGIAGSPSPTFKVSSHAYIQGNHLTDQSVSNVKLNSGSWDNTKITVEALSSDASIGVTSPYGVFTNGGVAAQYIDNFTSDNANYAVFKEGNELKLEAGRTCIVTFKVVNGSWDDETTADKTVTLTGHVGDTLNLTAAKIPAVGSKPNDTYKAGSWDVIPSTDTAITEATTYTYTYAAKEAAVVTKAPEAKSLTYNGQAQELVAAGTATGGEIQYALGTSTEATQPYTISIPTATNAGTYYVWYKVVGDENHADTEPVMLEVEIAEKGETEIKTEVKKDEKSPDIKVTNLTDEFAESTLSDDEKTAIEEAINNGEDVNVNVYLEIEDISDAISASDKEKINASATNADNIAFFDISLFKEISISGQSRGATSIHELATPLKLTIGVPKSFPTVEDGYTRTYEVIRLHEGNVEKLPTTSNADGTITFETDKFSTYALAYTDVKKEEATTETPTTKVDTPTASETPKADVPKAENTNKDNKVSTGDKINIGVIVMLMMDSAMAALYLTLRRRMMK